MTVDDLLTDLLRREGGEQNHPADLDGPLPTKFGITASTLAWWRKRPVTGADMHTLTAEEARQVYEQLFVRGPGFHLVRDDQLRAQLVDFGVHSGPGVAIRKLQAVLGVEPDGQLGPDTLKKLDEHPGRDIANQLALRRAWMLSDLVAAKPSQVAFLRGWIRRALSFIV